MKIAIYSKATGRVRQFTYCGKDEAALNAFEGEGYLEVDAIPMGDWEVVDGQLRQIPDKPSEFTYDVMRRAEYPKEGDQLDAIWKTLAKLDPLLLDPETQSTMQQINAVKAKYPKPDDSN